jgi:CubicO group peptidase (beta-lactamase class C family)
MNPYPLGGHQGYSERGKIMISPEEVGLSSERLARIRPVVGKHIGDDKIAGAVTLVARRGKVAHLECVGLIDRESNKSMQPDTIFRIGSMTKPITCVAMLMLYEQGGFQLFDPVSKFIPAFNDLKVYEGGAGSDIKLADLQRPVTVRDLLTHTSGLTYHFLEYGRVEEMYRERRVSSLKPLSGFVADLLELPLAFQPGANWRYSYAHDVVAHLIEILSNRPLDVYLQQSLFEPLEMVDTGFYVPEGKLDRFASMYGSVDIDRSDTTITKWYEEVEGGVNRRLASPEDSLQSKRHHVLRGGAGLVSTVSDYWRFCQMLLNKGELEGKHFLGRKTVELMTTNHLPPELMPYEVGGVHSPGYGYGLGVRVLMDVGQCQSVGSEGAYSWGGAATTSFWVDPKEELIGIQMAQFQPMGFHPIAEDFRVMAYQSIVD